MFWSSLLVCWPVPVTNLSFNCAQYVCVSVCSLCLCHCSYAHDGHIVFDCLCASGEKPDREVLNMHLDNLKHMVQYGENQVQCRRQFLLAYFGEVFDQRACKQDTRHACDVCSNSVCYLIPLQHRPSQKHSLGIYIYIYVPPPIPPPSTNATAVYCDVKNFRGGATSGYSKKDSFVGWRGWGTSLHCTMKVGRARVLRRVSGQLPAVRRDSGRAHDPA